MRARLSRRLLGLPRLRVQSPWSLILGLVIWSLAAIFLPQQFPDWPMWLHWLTATVTGLLLLGSAITHELAHTFVARRLGVFPRSGGTFVEWRGSSKEGILGRPKDLIVSALAGPVLNLALVPVFWVTGLAVGSVVEPLAAASAYTAMVNLLLAFGNLLPFLPLDGGWVLNGLLWAATGDRSRAGHIALSLSQGVGVVVVGVGALAMFSGAVLVGAWAVLSGLVLTSAARLPPEAAEETNGRA